jgi:molybdopterin-guanine dinucleotide biosynthesis protein A
MDDVTGFVLAGGRSTRMGADKASLDWHGRPLAEHALELVGAITKDVFIVGKIPALAKTGPGRGTHTVIEDVYPDRGPLAGIHAALASSTTELNLVLAVDMPFVVPAFLEYLVAQARGSSAVVTVPRIPHPVAPKPGATRVGHPDWQWQPLCAVYRRSFAEVAEAALRAGRNKIDALFGEVSLRIIDEAELQRLSFDPAMFDNLNTREEFEQARARQVRSS